MKSILALIAIAFAFTLGSCQCPANAKKTSSCCASGSGDCCK